jgi:hypothetical protein
MVQEDGEKSNRGVESNAKILHVEVVRMALLSQCAFLAIVT